MTAAENVQAIAAAIDEFYRNPDDVRTLQPVGSLERQSNLDAVLHSHKKAENNRATVSEPEIEIQEPDAFGTMTITISGDHGTVAIRVNASPFAEYVKTPKAVDAEPIPGAGPVDNPHVWARLARWAVCGEKKFVDRVSA